MMFMGVEMDIKKEMEQYEAVLKEAGYGHRSLSKSSLGYLNPITQFGFEVWFNAQKQAVPEGFVLVPKEPCAYLIKHKLWNKNSQPEIYLADDFIGDDGVEREKLIVCIPLYKGDDEVQEQSHD